MLLECVGDETVAEFMVRRKTLGALACSADSEIPLFNEHMRIANQHGMEYQRLWSSSSACGMVAQISGTRSAAAHARLCVLSLWLLGSWS